MLQKLKRRQIFIDIIKKNLPDLKIFYKFKNKISKRKKINFSDNLLKYAIN